MDLIALLDVLPPSWLPWVHLVCEVVAVMSVVMALVIKPLLGVPHDDDSKLKRVLFAVADWLERTTAWNTTPLRQKAAHAKLAAENATLQDVKAALTGSIPPGLESEDVEWLSAPVSMPPPKPRRKS